MVYYCGECGSTCGAIGVNNGIGAYEFHGQISHDTHYEYESDCCGATCFENEDLSVESNYLEDLYELKCLKADYDRECRRDEMLERNWLTKEK